MKTSRLLFISAALLLIGAGCAQPAPTATTSEPTIPATTPSPPPTALTAPPAATPDQPVSQTETNPPAMQKTWTFPGVLPENQISNRQIRIKTAKGDIIFELFDKEAPKTVSNFVSLAKGGFYDGLLFHRYVKDFVIQGGDPLTRDPNAQASWGTGGPGYQFEDEPVKREYTHGIVAMANSGSNTNGSQFFIMVADYALDPKYTVFGKVTKGLDIVDQLRVGDMMKEVIVEAKSK
jgi:cyclophilin family peptidyl-prolyl cis-trans isomerase